MCHDMESVSKSYGPVTATGLQFMFQLGHVGLSQHPGNCCFFSAGSWVVHDAMSLKSSYGPVTATSAFTATGLWFHGGCRLQAL